MRTTPLFDAYVMADWSAASRPVCGKDSIWIGQATRRNGALRIAAPRNLPTRHAAGAAIGEILAGNLAAGRRTLAGFDFAFGYPRGTAAALGITGKPWCGMWDALAARIEDDAGNGNNRFAVARALNERISGVPAPFWGCPPNTGDRLLSPTKQPWPDGLGFCERRLTEQRLSGPKPVWQLYGAGCVGSQSLTGIPVLCRLRNHPALKQAIRVWPFETGLRRLGATDTAGRIILAEIYPSSVKITQRAGEVRDAAQVREFARRCAELDSSGALAPFFDAGLDHEERSCVESEEGWILALSGRNEEMKKVHYAYLRDADAIYHESFARIAREVDLSRFPSELHPLALRLVHAAGDPAILADLVWSPGAVAAGQQALQAGARILVDAKMVAAGVSEKFLPAKNRLFCALDDRRVADLAAGLGTTRSAAAVELWRRHLKGAVVAIGNAPTALFHLLEMIGRGAPLPALVLGFPVGFVGAAEAKAALAGNELGIPFVALSGRRGGSALAAAAVNALAQAAKRP